MLTDASTDFIVLYNANDIQFYGGKLSTYLADDTCI